MSKIKTTLIMVLVTLCYCLIGFLCAYTTNNSLYVLLIGLGLSILSIVISLFTSKDSLTFGISVGTMFILQVTALALAFCNIDYIYTIAILGTLNIIEFIGLIATTIKK